MSIVHKTPRLDELLRTVAARLAEDGHGSKTSLARQIGATKQKVQAWIKGTAKPNGEMALALREWSLRNDSSAAPRKLVPTRRPAKPSRKGAR